MIRLSSTKQPPEVYEAVKKVIASGRFVKGPQVEAFENAWAKRCGMKYAVGVSSGAMALELAIQVSFQWNPNMPISYTSHTFRAIPNAISRLQFLPRADTYRPAIYAHHLHDQKPIYTPIIEDCSHCHGYIPYAETAIFSFYPTKILGAIGDAGIIVTDDELVASQCQALRNHSAPNGTNARMDEIQAAALLAKLPYLDTWIARRQEIVKMYDAVLNRHTEGQYHYAYAIPGTKEKRQRLEDLGVESQFYYDQDYMALPLHPDLTNREVEKVIDAIKKL